MQKNATVAKETSIFRRNLSVLQGRDPELVQKILHIPETNNLTCEITKSRNGSKNLEVHRDDKTFTLHSKYDPLKEAEQLVDSAYDEKRNYFIVYGLGLGYQLDALKARTIESDLIFIMEPSLDLFRKTLQQKDMTQILSSSNVSWSVGETPETAFARWSRTYNIARMDGLGIIELPAIRKVADPDYLKRFNNQMKGLLVTAGGNLQTLMLMAKTYQANTLQNLRYVLTNPPLMSLFGKFTGKPAIIISAGPSLDKNIDLLLEARDKALLIAVDTSLKPLRAKGIVPHLICTGDPQEANYKHIKDASDIDAYLIAEPMTNNKSFRDFNGKLFTATYGDKVVTWLENFIPQLGHVVCWGSVATMAFDVARKLGADPIIFVGQDLSFPEGRTYAKGTYFETDEKRRMTVEEQEKNGVYDVEDIYGNKITTNRQMFAYHKWFAGEISKTSAKVINATEGGILKEGVQIMTLREALDSFCSEHWDALGIIKSEAARFTPVDGQKLKVGLEKMTKDLKEMREISEKAFENAKEWLQNSSKYETLPKTIAIENMNSLEAARKKMVAKGDAFKFLEMADQCAIKNFLKGYRMIDGKKISLSTYQQVLEIYIKLFASVYRTLGFQIPIFNSASQNVRNYIGISE
jgi:hypothetical protein